MAKEQTRKTKSVREEISDLQKTIIANSKDAAWMKKQLARLLSLKGQESVEPVELIVPAKEVVDSIDFGACKVYKTIRGFMFEAKGGMKTFVELRMAGVCAMFNTLFAMRDGEVNDELYDSYSSALQYIFQGPIFASLNDEVFFKSATDIIKNFNEYYENEVENAQLKPETQEDIEANNAIENISKTLENSTGKC